MYRSRALSFFLIAIVWFTSTGFNPSPEIQHSFSLAVSPSSGNPAPVAAVTLGKIYPGKGVSGIPANSVTLQWGAVQGYTGAVTYRYCLQPRKNCPTARWIRVGSALSATVTNLMPGQLYTWWVRAYNSQNVLVAEADGGPWTFTTLPLPGDFSKTGPAAPNNENLPTSGVRLYWSATSTNAASYEYCMDTTNDNLCDPTTGWKPASSGVTLPDLHLNTVYFWQVRAVNGSGTTQADGGAWWQISTIIVPGVFDKLSPHDLATGQPVNGLMLSWTKSFSATGYQYCVIPATTLPPTCPSLSDWQPAGSLTYAVLNGLSYSTDYYWQVQTVPAGASGADGDVWWKFTTQPPLPMSFSKLAPNDTVTNVYTDVTFTWEPSEGATGYEFCISTPAPDPACGDSPWDIVTGTSTTVLGLDLGTQYFWQVRAINETGTTESNLSAWWSFTTQLSPPSGLVFTKTAPTNGATQLDTSLTLTWNPSSTMNAAYQVCYDTTDNDTCDEVNGLENWRSAITSSSYNLSGLSSGTTYYWQVRATNTGGTTYADYDMAAWWSFTTAYAPPADFQKSSPQDVTLNQPVLLTWIASSPGSTYEVCYDQSAGDTCDGDAWLPVPSVDGTMFSLTSLDRAATYYWQVRAKNIEGTITEADEGSWWSFTTTPYPPAGFTKAAPIDGATKIDVDLSLTWNASTTEGTSYQVCLVVSGETCDAADWQPVTVEMGNTFPVTGLSEGQTYDWQVRGSNAGGTTYADGTEIDRWSFTTLLSAPKGFNKSAPEDASSIHPLSLALTWTTSDLDAAYEVCYDSIEDAVCAGDDWQPVISGTAFNLTGLDYATTYYWQVRAKNSEGRATEADTGAWWSFTTMHAAPGSFDKSSPSDGATSQPANPTLEWGSSDLGVTYDYCVSLTDGECGSEQDWVPAVERSAVTASLSYDTTYYWQVRAKNSEGTITQANTGTWWSFSTYSQPPADFVKVGPANHATNRPLNLSLSWASAGAGFTYEYCLSEVIPLDCGTSWLPVSTTSVQPANIKNSTTYYWQVRAKDSSGHTTDANLADANPTWQFSTRPTPPSSSDVTYDNINEDQNIARDLPGAGLMTFALYPDGPQPVGTLMLSPTGSFTYQPPLNFYGPVQFQFTVTDGINDPVGPYTVTINYVPVNDPPVLDPIAAVIVNSGEIAAFTPSASDPDLPPGTQLTYTIDFLPAGASFDPASGAFQWPVSWSPEASNVHTFTVTVSDGVPTENPVQQTVTITVLARQIFLPLILR